MRKPGRKHFQAIIHLLQFIKHNPRRGLMYYRDYEKSPVHLFLRDAGIEIDDVIFGMHDSSWQDCPDTGRSTGCYLNFVAGGVVDFNSFVPDPVAMSSTEAEMNATAVGAMSMSYVRMLWNELHIAEVDLLWKSLIRMFCDNNGAVLSANSDKDSKALRHTKRRMFYIRQVRKEGEMSWEFVDGVHNLSDIGTKNNEAHVFALLTENLLVEVPE